MKYLITMILLALAPLSWGNDDIEWPVELTCDFGHSIIQLHISGDKKTSWFRGVYTIWPGMTKPFSQKQMQKKLYKVRRIKVSPAYLSVELGWGFPNSRLWIFEVDRHTLRAAVNFANDGPSGNCEMGLLNVEETPRQF